MSDTDLWLLGLLCIAVAILAVGVLIGYGMGREAQGDIDRELLQAQALKIRHLERGGMRR